MKPIRSHLLQWGMYFIGLLIMSYGIVLSITANLGVSPWDVLHLGLAATTPLTPGMAVQLTGILIVALVCYLMKRLPQIGTILNMVLVGLFIDLFLYYPFFPEPDRWYEQLVVLLIGIVLTGIGAGLYLACNLGAGPRDGLMLVIHLRKGWKVSRIKTGMELVVLVIGALLGGPVGIGTIILSLSIGPLMGFSLDFLKKSIGKYTVKEENVYETFN